MASQIIILQGGGRQTEDQRNNVQGHEEVIKFRENPDYTMDIGFSLEGS